MIKRHENGAIRRELNFFRRFEMDFAGRNRGFQVIDDFAQIGDKIDILIVGVVGETLIGAADRRNAGGCFV